MEVNELLEEKKKERKKENKQTNKTLIIRINHDRIYEVQVAITEARQILYDKTSPSPVTSLLQVCHDVKVRRPLDLEMLYAENGDSLRIASAIKRLKYFHAGSE